MKHAAYPVAFVLCLLSACDRPAEPEPEPPRPAAIHLTPPEIELPALGSTIRLTAEVRDQYGQIMPPGVVSWSSDSPRIASVDASGLVMAIANGTAMIQASAGTVSKSTRVAVVQVAAMIDVAPSSDTLLIGDTLRLAANALDANGHMIAWAAITWTSRNPRIAEVDRSGLVTGMAAGQVMVEASTESGATGGVEIEVVSPVPSVVTVTPDTVVFVALGEMAMLTVGVFDQAGRSMEGAAVSWSSGDTLVAVVDSQGVVVAVADGETVAMASVGGVSAAAAIKVEQAVVSAIVTPAVDTVAVGDTLRLVAEALDGNGHPVAGVGFVWQSSDTMVVRVDTSGLVTGVGEGTATIILSTGDVTATAAIMVENPVVNPDRAALVALYEATGGSNWSRSGNWLTDHPLRYWYGITVNDDGRVTSLHLGNNNLHGEVPPEIGNLTALQKLILSNNDLAGPIPPELGNLSRLEHLSIQGSGLTGQIPPEFGDMTALRDIHLTDNDLTGPIPPELGNLTALKALVLSQNALTGEIPPELGKLTALERLYLRLNDLTGPIPPELANLSNLGEYGLSLDLGPGELCVPDHARLRAWLLERGASAFPCQDDPSIRLLPRALFREDGAGAKVLLPDEYHSPSAVTVSDPSVVTASIHDGRWLELVPKGRGSAAVEVVPSGQGVPGIAEVVVRRAVGTFGIEFVMEQPAPIGAEEALTAAADWWSSVLNGTEWPRQGFGASCGSFAVPLGKPAGLFLDVVVGSGSGMSVKLHCFGRFSSSGSLRTGPGTGLGYWPSVYDGARRSIGYFLGLAAHWSPFTEVSELLSPDGAYFVGERATAAFRAGGGDPSLPGVPLASRRAWHGNHVACELTAASGDSDCGRLTMDAISLAALADLGYAVDMSKATPWRKE